MDGQDLDDIGTTTEAKVECYQNDFVDDRLEVEKSKELLEILKEHKKFHLKEFFFESSDQSFRAPAKRLARSLCPILQWYPTVTKKQFLSDVIAGISVAMTAIPQAMSYSSIAGVPYGWGLNANGMATLLYCFMGGCRQLAVGPVALLSIILAGLDGELTPEECPAFFKPDNKISQSRLCPEAYTGLVIVATFLAGIIQLATAVTGLSFLVSFLSHPVVAGFTSASAIIIALSQCKYVLGIKIPNSEYVQEVLYDMGGEIGHTNTTALGLGLLWMVMIIALNKATEKFEKMRWMKPLAPLLACIVAIIICYATSLKNNVDIVGIIPSQLPSVRFPDLSKPNLDRVIGVSISVALIGFMEGIAIGKALAVKMGDNLDSQHELGAFGVTNIIVSCCQGFAITGSFAKSSISASTGCKSQVTGATVAVTIFVTLLLLTPVFQYLPKFCLAAIIITSVTKLIAWREFIHLYKVKKQDAGLFALTFICTLFAGIINGIGISVLVSLSMIIAESARPQMSILWNIPGTKVMAYLGDIIISLLHSRPTEISSRKLG